MSVGAAPVTPPVTLLTRAAASAETLTDADYREIYDELRSKCALRQFAAAIGSAVSFGWWSNYERDASAVLSRARRNELRRAVGLPELPVTVAQAVAGVDPDATVYQVGAAAAARVVLVGADAPPALTLRLNGALAVADDVPQNADVMAVTCPRRRAPRGTILVSIALRQRLNAARVAAGQTWEEYLTARMKRQEEDAI